MKERKRVGNSRDIKHYKSSINRLAAAEKKSMIIYKEIKAEKLGL
jgi:hypothetical protein